MSPSGIGRGRRQREYPAGTPHPVDAHVGSRVRLRRTMMGMSQETLELVRAYYRISDPGVRKKVFDLLHAMTNLPDPS